ncbi:hypothetical protein IMSHALPRED_006163 [Imshaugia aleurites]|uniref:Aminoglycoside phosphotransferase domain-containing protein n=1 Tax=Imshaugia aleurites TaxID=172621 RepID=A0A8H3FH35_9LECA|nr:hypothetical protein IMSHALPRED_006163 [Imshaugia aleurites]
MGKPSDHWTSFQELDRQSLHSQKIDLVLKNANFVHLCSIASQARLSNDNLHNDGGSSQCLQCSIDPSEFSAGYNNVVFEVAFSDSSQWVARVRLPENGASKRDHIETAMLSEIATLRIVASKTTIPVPTIYHFNVDASNDFGFRYILMQALPGRRPQSGLARSVPEEHMDKITDQLAGYYHQLSRLHFDRIGRLWCGRSAQEQPSIIPVRKVGGPFSTSLEYFYVLRKSDNRSIQSKHAGDKEWMTAAWILEQALPSMIVENFIHGPFPLCHIDLHYNNILIDEDFNITGIIDWSDSQTVPLERFLTTPEFTTFPGLSVEQNAPIVVFREKFAAALKKRERGDDLPDDKSGNESNEKVPTAPVHAPPRFISDIIGTPLWEIVFRCTYSYPWRAKTDAALVLRQIFGGSVTWEDLVQYRDSGPMSRLGRF